MRQKYRRVSVGLRCQIMALLRTKISVQAISRHLSLHRSTIYREMKRNRAPGATYSVGVAHAMAMKRRQSCRKRRAFENKEISDLVVRGLEAGLSPELIAGRTGRVSHQTIYSELWLRRPELRIHLPRFGKRRGRGRAGRRSRSEKPKTSCFVNIKKRPESANKRSRLGHWERDTMFVQNREMILVVQERKSRYVRIEKANKHSYQNIPSQTNRLIKVGTQKPRSVTNDNGTEFFEPDKVGVPVYFCDPYSPHQRGSIENVIGQIRRYLPRTTNIEMITNKKLRKIEDKLNFRPKKCLGYRTPHEVIFKTSVALAL